MTVADAAGRAVAGEEAASFFTQHLSGLKQISSCSDTKKDARMMKRLKIAGVHEIDVCIGTCSRRMT